MRNLVLVWAFFTGLALIWFGMLFVMAPVGVSDVIFGRLREQLADRVPPEELNRVSAQLSSQLGSAVPQSMLVGAGPLLVAAIGWTIGCLKRTGSGDRADQAQSHST